MEESVSWPGSNKSTHKAPEVGSSTVDGQFLDGVSVVIITLNEEHNLRRTLESVQWADEIVVVDSGSTDATVVVAREFRARVIHQDWLGFAAQKNFAISQCRHLWVLSLDADEQVGLTLQDEIQKIVSAGSAFEGFYVNRRNYFLGRWMKHAGFYPDPKLRLFKNGAARFGETAVHETLQCSGSTARLSGDLEHYAYPTLESYIEHMNRYSSLGAVEVVKRGRKTGLVRDALLRPLLTFFYNYICRLGLLDGREGLLLNLYHAVYVSLKYSKAWAERRGQRRGQ